MKATIKRIRWTAVEVEIPEKCPECAADLGKDAVLPLHVSVLESATRRAVVLDTRIETGGVATDARPRPQIEEGYMVLCSKCGARLAGETARAAPETGATVPVAVLTREERTLLCDVIERFGSGEHPAPTMEVLQSFAADYALACLSKALKGGALNAKGADLGRGIGRVLEATVHGEESSWR